MRYLFIITIACAIVCLLTACATPVKRQVYFIPVYNERVLLTGGVKFIENSEEVSYFAPEMKHPPKIVQSTRMDDGSLKLTWISFRDQPEKIMYLATGMHPVEIPSNIVKESKDLDLDTEMPIGDPFILQGFGETTAYVPDLIKFGDHIKIPK